MPAKLRPLHDCPFPFADQVAPLLAAARDIRRNAYAPYSQFQVGAAVLTADLRIHVGTNVEGVDYDVTHAEESAFSAMVSSLPAMPVMIVAVGSKDRDLLEAPVVSPCGKCRQKIYEWIIGDRLLGVRADIDVIVTDPDSGAPMLCSIRELLPLSFGC